VARLPTDTHSHFVAVDLCGVLHAARDEWASAALCYERALALNTRHRFNADAGWRYSTTAALGEALVDSGSYERAVPALEEALAHLDEFADVDTRWRESLPRYLATAQVALK